MDDMNCDHIDCGQAAVFFIAGNGIPWLTNNFSCDVHLGHFCKLFGQSRVTPLSLCGPMSLDYFRGLHDAAQDEFKNRRPNLGG